MVTGFLTTGETPLERTRRSVTCFVYSLGLVRLSGTYGTVSVGLKPLRPRGRTGSNPVLGTGAKHVLRNLATLSGRPLRPNWSRDGHGSPARPDRHRVRVVCWRRLTLAHTFRIGVSGDLPYQHLPRELACRPHHVRLHTYRIGGVASGSNHDFVGGLRTSGGWGRRGSSSGWRVSVVVAIVIDSINIVDVVRATYGRGSATLPHASSAVRCSRARAACQCQWVQSDAWPGSAALPPRLQPLGNSERWCWVERSSKCDDRLKMGSGDGWARRVEDVHDDRGVVGADVQLLAFGAGQCCRDGVGDPLNRSNGSDRSPVLPQ